MHARRMEFTAWIALTGTAVWAGLAVPAGLRRAPLGVMELLFLFAVLVVVPLGLELAKAQTGRSAASQVVSVLHPFAALAAVASFWQRPGLIAAALSVPWLVFGLSTAASGIRNLYRSPTRSLADLAMSLAGVDLAFAGGWLVVSRAGLHPMGFQEPIVLLTSVHFHYSGFAVAVLAGQAIRTCQRHKATVGPLRPIVCLVLSLPFLLAAGFVISPILRLAAAIGLAFSVPAFSACLFLIAKNLDPTARVYLRAGAIAAWLAMGLAGAYAVTDYMGKAFLSMPGMASTHGVLNGVGFVLFSMLAFLMEENLIGATTSSEVPTNVIARRVVRRKPAASVPSHVPEFVAREFYDR